MLIGKKSGFMIRGGRPCTARKNGSGVDLWVERNGESFFLFLSADTLAELSALNGRTDHSSTSVTVEYDSEVPLG